LTHIPPCRSCRKGDADMVVNCLFQLPELRLISLAIGTNFAPEVRRSKPSQHSLFLPIILSLTCLSTCFHSTASRGRLPPSPTSARNPPPPLQTLRRQSLLPPIPCRVVLRLLSPRPCSLASRVKRRRLRRRRRAGEREVQVPFDRPGGSTETFGGFFGS
jgi:hypothetical protein